MRVLHCKKEQLALLLSSLPEFLAKGMFRKHSAKKLPWPEVILVLTGGIHFCYIFVGRASNLFAHIRPHLLACYLVLGFVGLNGNDDPPPGR